MESIGSILEQDHIDEGKGSLFTFDPSIEPPQMSIQPLLNDLSPESSNTVEKKIDLLIKLVTGVDKRLQAIEKVISNTEKASIFEVKSSSVSKETLETACNDIFEQNVQANAAQIDEIVCRIYDVDNIKSLKGVNVKDLISKIKEWFRKKREYLGHRVYQLAEMYYARIIHTDQDLEDQRNILIDSEEMDPASQQAKAILEKRSAILSLMKKEAKAETMEENNWDLFCRAKLIYHLEVHGDKHLLQKKKKRTN